ncbi:hypothetical protein WJX81_002699 [Elliptochloris bilobata]|uniref:Uncharacterized protein n=1 Tax=Elliptochloris bilobata TaxID=381761 RepID=A0AAW1RR61_9CHLO
MPGVAFDGSIWVTGGQTVGLVVGSVLFTCAGALAMSNASRRFEERQASEQFTQPQPRSRPDAILSAERMLEV